MWDNLTAVSEHIRTSHPVASTRTPNHLFYHYVQCLVYHAVLLSQDRHELWHIGNYQLHIIVECICGCFRKHSSLRWYSALSSKLHWATGGWWHLNCGGRARGNGWSGIGGMVSNTSNTWFPCLVPFHWLRSSHYYEPSSPQQHHVHLASIWNDCSSLMPFTFYTVKR